MLFRSARGSEGSCVMAVSTLGPRPWAETASGDTGRPRQGAETGADGGEGVRKAPGATAAPSRGSTARRCGGGLWGCGLPGGCERCGECRAHCVCTAGTRERGDV